jgi:hypothetical protein
LLVACNAEVSIETAPGSGGTTSRGASSASGEGGTTSNGASSTSGTVATSTGAGGADAKCGALIADLTDKLQAARHCTPGSGWDECDQTEATKDECGCAVPLNHIDAGAVAAAKAASDSVSLGGCASQCEPSPCQARYSDPNYQGGCAGDVCKWTGAD